MRVVEDHHVDRPEVEVRQRMQPTGTNSSNGLIISSLPSNSVFSSSDGGLPVLISNAFGFVFDRSGGNSEESLPDSIPNSAVKFLCADGTAS